MFPVQVLPIYPDFDLWKYTYSQVIFDTDPASKAKNSIQVEEMSQAMIKLVKEMNYYFFLSLNPDYFFRSTKDKNWLFLTK